MHQTLTKYLDELSTEIEVTVSTDLNKEALENCVTFGVDKKLTELWGAVSIGEFLEASSIIYAEKTNGNPMVFYAWLDEMAGQIRISAVSRKHKKLPFSCKMISSSLEELVQNICNANSGLYSAGKLYIWEKYI